MQHLLLLVAAWLVVPRTVVGQAADWQPQPVDELIRLARGREHAALLVRQNAWPQLQRYAVGDTVWVMAEQWPDDWRPPSRLLKTLTREERLQPAASTRVVHYIAFELSGVDTLWVGAGTVRRCGGSEGWSAWVWGGDTWVHTGVGRGVSSARAHCP